MRLSVCGVLVRRYMWVVGLGLAMAAESTVHGQVDIVCDGVTVGTVEFMTATTASGRPGVVGSFTASINDAMGKPSIAAAAAKCNEDHFNWYQVITADSMPPNDAAGNPLVPPYPDPPAGGYGPPSTQWADDLPWYWDEGPDPAAGTDGFSDNYNVNDNTTDGNGDGVNDTLEFQDFPGGADGTELTFRLWLVSLNADSSLHSFHDGGIEWSFSNPVGGNGTDDWTTSIDLSLAFDPTKGEYEIPTEGMASSVPATVWDTVFNNSNQPVDFSETSWTRDGKEIGQTFPGGVVLPGQNPPEERSDHVTLPETPNDLHFRAFLPFAETQIDVWAFWDTTQDPGFDFQFDMFQIPGVNQMDLQYIFDPQFGPQLIVTDIGQPSRPNVIFDGPLELFDPHQIDMGQGPGFFLDQLQLSQVMPEFGQFGLPGDFDGDGIVGANDLNLVLFNWNVPGLLLPPEWVQQLPVFGSRGDFFDLPVGVDQLNQVLFHWGTGLNEFPVPEPTSWSLILLAAMAFHGKRNRR